MKLLSFLFVALTLTAQLPQSVMDTTTLGPSINLNSEYWGGGNPVRVANETQVVAGASRTEFNLANCHDPSCLFYNVAVYHNGARLTPDVDYGRSAFTVFLNIPAVAGDRVMFDYAYFFTPWPVPPTGTN